MNLCLHYTANLVHPLWIVTWKVGCPCVSLQVCPSPLTFVATPCLDCVQASVHEFMSTWLLMSGPLPMHSLMETWGAPVWQCVCVPVISFLLPQPCLECVHASVHEFMSTLHPMSGPPPKDSYMESWVPLCVTACVSQSPYVCCYTLFRMCTCISTWIYVHLAAYVWSTTYA